MNTALIAVACLAVGQADAPIKVQETENYVLIETDALQAKINKKGYVSGIAAGSLLDKKTGGRDLGFGLHIMDFLLAPGWRDDDYSRDPLLHGKGFKKKVPGQTELWFYDPAKHYVEGPQICTQARKLTPEIIKGDNFVAIRLKFRFTQPHNGFKAGSLWQQTLVFQPKVRHVVSSESITSVNDVENLLYRIDMPGHVKHKNGDTFAQVYLSYRGQIPAKEFLKDFAPDDKFLYQRKDNKLPARMIRAYQIKHEGKPGPWIAGMTLDPAVTVEAWCHQRGYICFIQELHGRKVKAGETFGAAYQVGYFDDVPAMEKAYDRHRGARRIEINAKGWALK
ncbi:MAG: hypothetical protein HYX68_16535 [Planctomycetes bacterium]|nr:hypothetical protein [Planctomycetota bacterium]